MKRGGWARFVIFIATWICTYLLAGKALALLPLNLVFIFAPLVAFLLGMASGWTDRRLNREFAQSWYGPTFGAIFLISSALRSSHEGQIPEAVYALGRIALGFCGLLGLVTFCWLVKDWQYLRIEGRRIQSSEDEQPAPWTGRG